MESYNVTTEDGEEFEITKENFDELKHILKGQIRLLIQLTI